MSVTRVNSVHDGRVTRVNSVTPRRALSHMLIQSPHDGHCLSNVLTQSPHSGRCPSHVLNTEGHIGWVSCWNSRSQQVAEWTHQQLTGLLKTQKTEDSNFCTLTCEQVKKNYPNRLIPVWRTAANCSFLLSRNSVFNPNGLALFFKHRKLRDSISLF